MPITITVKRYKVFSPDLIDWNGGFPLTNANEETIPYIANIWYRNGKPPPQPASNEKKKIFLLSL